MNLNEATPAQREAITTDSDVVLCAAGPGSGKSATLVARIKHLKEIGIMPAEIVAISFTNAASHVLQDRLEGIELGANSTLHAFALRMLKIHGECLGYGDRLAVVSPESAIDLIASKAKALGCKATMKELMLLKGKGRPPRAGRLDLPSTVIASYYDDLKTTGIVDYDTILSEFLELLTSKDLACIEAQKKIGTDYTHLLVDEVQDSSPLDWKIYEAMPCLKKFFVGDSDQAIFSFRGGSLAGMLALADKPGTQLIKLEANFRSRSKICEAANRLIAHNQNRVAKETRSFKGTGGRVYAALPCMNDGEELSAVARTIKRTQGEKPEATFAVLARTNFIADAYRKGLAATGINVVERTTADLPRDWPYARGLVELLVYPDNDVLAFFYLIGLYEKQGDTPKAARDRAHAARKVAHAAGKSINQSLLHFGRVTKANVAMQALASAGASKEAQMIAAERLRELPAGSGMMEFALSLAEVHTYAKDGEGDGVQCLTIHGAKGKEFDVVFLVGLEDEVLPGNRAGEDIEECRRLAYVAITRAREQVYLVHSLSRLTAWGQVANHKASRFIAEMTEGGTNHG